MWLGDLTSAQIFDWLCQQSDYNCPITRKCPINDLSTNQIRGNCNTLDVCEYEHATAVSKLRAPPVWENLPRQSYHLLHCLCFPVPGAVEGLSVVTESYDTIAVSWETPKEKNGKIQHYLVTHNSTDMKFAGSLSTSQLSIKLVGLSPNTTYVVMVTARTSTGYGAAVSGNATTGE